MEMNNDILRLLNDDELEKLKRLYQKPGAMTFNHYAIIYTQIDWNQKYNVLNEQNPSKLWSDRFRTKYYTHRYGDFNKNGTFVSISGENDYFVSYATLEESQQELRECLEKTKLINYSLGPCIQNIPDDQLSHIYHIAKRDGLVFEFDYPSVGHWIPKDTAKNFHYTIPVDVEIRPLQMGDVETIDQIWPHQYPGSKIFIENLVELNGGLGIFSKDSTNELRAWILKNEFSGLGLLHTIEAHCRKGYGSLLAKAMAKKIATDDDENVNLFIVKANTVSRQLFQRLGAEEIQYLRWMRIKRSTEKS